MAQENIEADYLNEERLYFFHINGRKYMITFYEKSMRQRNMDPRYWTERSVRRRPQFVAESELHSRTRSGSVGFCVRGTRTQPLICVACSVLYLDCKTVRIFAYSSTREQSNKRSGMRLKTESETGERRFFFSSRTRPWLARFARVRLLRHVLPISLLILRKKPTVLQSILT